MFKYSFLRYGLVGFLTVLLDFLLLFLFFNILTLTLDISVSLAFILSLVFNFFFHRSYTFKKANGNAKWQLKKYLLIVLISYFITLFLVNYFVDMGLNIYLAKLITVGVVYIYGYLLGKFFVFNV
jgi:putative flippase GtrA